MMFDRVPWKSFVGRSSSIGGTHGGGDAAGSSGDVASTTFVPTSSSENNNSNNDITNIESTLERKPMANERTLNNLRAPSSSVRGRRSVEEDQKVLQRSRRSTSAMMLPQSSNDEQMERLASTAEEAVADPALTVELDLSEDAVGFRGREKPLKVLERILKQHLATTTASSDNVSTSNSLTDTAAAPSAISSTRASAAFAAPATQKYPPLSPETVLVEGRSESSHLPSPSNSEHNMVITSVLVSGTSGVGKTSLIRHFATLHQHKILFGAGKFDQYNENQHSFVGPFAILLKALQRAVQRILEEDQEGTGDLRQALRVSLNHHLTPSQRACIQELIPDSARLWSKEGGGTNPVDLRGYSSKKTNNHDTTAARRPFWDEHNKEWTNGAGGPGEPHFALNGMSRVTLALLSFLDAMASTEKILVLFMDDLQWADSLALSSIASLLMEFSTFSALPSSNAQFCITPAQSNEEGEGEAQVPADVLAAEINRRHNNTRINHDMPRTTYKKNLIFLGAFRSEDVDSKDKNKDSTPHRSSTVVTGVHGNGTEASALLGKMSLLNRMEWFANNLSTNSTSIRISISNLDYEHTHQIINSVLHLDSERTKTLADVVFRKTNGNPYFVLRYLEMLHRERLLYYSFDKYQWQWNLDLIQTETNVTDNVVHVLSRHLEHLEEELKVVLRLAACLGFYFDIAILREIVLREGILSDTARQSRFNSRVFEKEQLNTEREIETMLSLRSKVGLHTSKYGKLMDSRYDPILWRSEHDENKKLCAAWLGHVLTKAEKEGLIERASTTQYKFSHDRVQRCLYEATPAGKPRHMLHLRIGRLVRDTYLANLNVDDVRAQNAILYFAVEQLNMSSSYIVDVEERIGLIELNLEASDKAGDQLTFLTAASFLRKAQSLVQDEDWNHRYDLCLEVFSSLAEVEHSCGNSAGALRAVDVVLSRARSFDDKIRVIFIKVNDLGVQGRLAEAIKEGFAALEHLGEPLPSKPGLSTVLRDFHKTTKTLRKLSKNQLLNLPEMTDTKKKAAMRLLNSLSLFAWHTREESTLAVIFLRLMSITLRHGQNVYTPFAFATFAMLLAAHGDAITATEFGQLALEMLQRSKSLVALPRTHLIVYTFINHIRHPLLHGVEPLLNAHRVGLENGELEYGSLAVASYASLYVIFGLPLSTFSTDMRTISEQLHHFHQNVALAALLPWWQFGMNLMGECVDVLELTGEAMDQEEFQHSVSGNAAEMTLDFVRLMLFYIFDKLDSAMKLYDKLRKDKRKTFLSATHYIHHFHHCYCGLLNLAVARNTGKRKYKQNAKVHLTELDKLVNSGAINCHPMLVILKAEEYALNGDTAKAKETYNLAISRCARSGFVHLQAITNERAGLYMYEQGDDFWAGSYLSQALRNYYEWGAHAKARSLLEKCQVLGLDNSIQQFSSDSQQYKFSLKGRTRFKATPLQLRASLGG